MSAAIALLGIAFQQSGFKLLLEILVRARISSVREIPFAFGQRYRGASKANMKVAMDYGRLLARLYRTRFGLRRAVPVSFLRLTRSRSAATSQRGQCQAHQQKSHDTEKKHQRHAYAGLAIDFGHQVACPHIQRHAC